VSAAVSGVSTGVYHAATSRSAKFTDGTAR